MKFWVDAQLPPSLARWLAETFSVEAVSVRAPRPGLRDTVGATEAFLVVFDAAQDVPMPGMRQDVAPCPARRPPHLREPAGECFGSPAARGQPWDERLTWEERPEEAENGQSITVVGAQKGRPA